MDGIKGEIIQKKFNPKNPADWENSHLRDFIKNFCREMVDLEKFCPFETGKEIM